MFKFFKLKINFGNNPFAFSTGSVCTAVPTSRVDSWRQNFTHRYGYHGENTFPWKGSSRFRMYFFVVLVIVIFVVVFLPSVYSGATWVSKSTYPKKLVTVTHCSTLTVPPLLSPHCCSNITVPPSLFHHYRSTSLFCHYCSTSLFHSDYSTITVPLPLFHFNCSTITAPPLLFPLTVPLWQFNHYCSTFTLPPSLFHFYYPT